MIVCVTCLSSQLKVQASKEAEPWALPPLNFPLSEVTTADHGWATPSHTMLVEEEPTPLIVARW